MNVDASITGGQHDRVKRSVSLSEFVQQAVLLEASEGNNTTDDNKAKNYNVGSTCTLFPPEDNLWSR